MGRAARRSTIVAGSNRWSAPCRSANDLSRSAHPPGAGQHADRGRRAEPVELARGRDRAGPRAPPAEEARAGRGRPCSGCCIAGGTRRPRPDARSRASRSPSRPAGTASGWPAGCGPATSRPTSSTRPASPSRASTGGPRPTGSTPSCSSAPSSAGCAASRATAAWPRSRRSRRRTPGARTGSARAWSASAPAIVNRMKAALARLGIRGFKPTLRKAPERLEALRTPEGEPLPPNTLAELRRDMARLRLRARPDRGDRGGAPRGGWSRQPADRAGTRWCACWPGSSGSASRRRTCWCTRSSRATCGTAGRWRATPA